MASMWRTTVGVVALVGGLAAGVAPAAAGAGETGCPVAFETLSVSDMVTRGYTAAHLQPIDENADDTICGKPFNETKQEKFCESIGGCYVEVIYGLRDNDVAGR